jgi:hypothetical protein
MSTTDLKPEQKARKIIDQMLNVAGWDIVDRKHYTTLSSAVAIEEGLLKNNQEADYLLFIDGKAVGVLEAKREETNLDDKVYTQANNYTHSIPLWCSSWQTPLPIIYLSNGKKLLFKDTRNNEPPIEIKKIHTPKEIAEMLNIKGEFSGLPALKKQYGNMKLHDCQVDAVKNTEYLFRQGEKRALIVIATGAGKTYTACLQAYRPKKKEVRIIQLSNIGERGWRNDNVKYTTFDHAKSIQRSIVKPGDIVIAKMMPAGRAIICPSEDPQYILSSDCVRLEHSAFIDKEYLLDAINSEMFRKQVYSNVQGVTRVRTSLSKLRTYLIPLPPIKEQQRIANKIKDYYSLLDNLDMMIG